MSKGRAVGLGPGKSEARVQGLSAVLRGTPTCWSRARRFPGPSPCARCIRSPGWLAGRVRSCGLQPASWQLLLLQPLSGLQISHCLLSRTDLAAFPFLWAGAPTSGESNACRVRVGDCKAEERGGLLWCVVGGVCRYGVEGERRVGDFIQAPLLLQLQLWLWRPQVARGQGHQLCCSGVLVWLGSRRDARRV